MERINAWVLEQYVAAMGRLEAEEGQGLVEYALILALVSIAAIAVLPGLGAAVTTVFTTVTGSL